jgi:sulfite reductase beta subunit-like hemoprotein
VIPDQIQPGTNTVRVMIMRSELSAEAGAQVAPGPAPTATARVMLTARQNLQIRFVPDEKVPALLQELKDAGYTTEGHERLPDMVACVGTTQCNLAVSDTPNTYRALRGAGIPRACRSRSASCAST